MQPVEERLLQSALFGLTKFAKEEKGDKPKKKKTFKPDTPVESGDTETPEFRAALLKHLKKTFPGRSF